MSNKMKVAKALLISLLIMPFSICIAKNQTAIFAMGCFWCAQSDMDKVPGVIQTVVGYTGGDAKDATYETVSAGGTKHYEAIKVTYDDKKINYSQLLNAFWHNVDPLDAEGQFCDKGLQYRAAIFYSTPEEKQLAESSKAALEKSGIKPIATLILPATSFYPAETYHQNYYKINPVRYNYYRYSCGRDARLKEVWTTKNTDS